MTKRFEVVLNEFDEVEYIMDKEMMEDRDFAEFIDFVEDVCKENEQLKNRVDELEDDNMKYTLSTDKLEEYTKRFMPTKCINEFRDCKTNRYYWLDNEDNFTGALELLNLLDCENEQLKQQLFETSKELLWATSDEVDRALHYEDEVEELRKEIFE